MGTIFDWLLTGFGAYRAGQDAGMWMIDQQAMGNYLEALLIDRGLM